jgi:tetratricopeptide (TPR) repeat protein
VIAVLGKERVIASRTPLETILLSTKSIAVTLQHFFFPLSLSPIYEQRGAISFLSADFAVSALVALAVLGLAFFSLWRRPRVSFGLLFFLVTLAPTFLSFQKGSAVFYAADHYAYLPSIGLLLALTVFLCERLEGAPTRLWRRIFGVSSIVLFLFLVLLSMKQTSIWESPERLFSHALALQPESVAARTALATVLRTSDRHEEAFELLRQGLRYGSDPDLHLQAGIIYAEVGKLREAREQFAKVLEEDPKRPEPHHYLGILAEVQGETNVALRDYAQAVKLDPSYVAARTKLARILFKEGRMEEAREQVEEALRWNPSFSEARELLRTLP